MSSTGRVQIGWASRDITPRTPVALRGQFNLRIATRVLDPLTLTALAVEAGDEQAILVSADLVAVDQMVMDGVRDGLPERLPDFDPRKVIVGATHTHTGPFCSRERGLQRDEDYLDAILARYPDYMSAAEYTEFLIQAILAAATEAWANRRPGWLGWGYSYAVVGENRRVCYFDGSAKMYGSTSDPNFAHIEGHVDHGVHLLFTYDAEQQLTGMIVNIACPTQASESGQDFVSADYWHDAREEIRRRHGGHLFILPQVSAAGDQSPHRLLNTRAERRMLALKYGDEVGRPLNAGLRLDLARRIADAVSDAEPAARKDLRDTVVCAHEYRTLDLPHWQITDAEYAEAQTQIAQLQAELEQLEDPDPLGSRRTAIESRIGWYQRVVDRYQNPRASIPADMNVLRLGDVAFVTAPFEYYLDFGDRIKGRSPALQTFVVQLTGGGGGGYLASERAATGLSYGAVPASCQVSPAGGHVLVEEAVATLERMFADG